MNLKTRSYQKELLDQENIPFSDIAQTMRELNTINTWLGGHAITIKGFKELLKELPASGCILYLFNAQLCINKPKSVSVFRVKSVSEFFTIILPILLYNTRY